MRRAALTLVLWAAAATPAAGQGYLVVVTGIAGDAPSRASFHEWASALAAAAPRLGLPDSHVIYLSENPTRTATRSTKANVERTLRAIAARAGPDDPVVLVLIGHGSDRGEPQFNLPGPDLSAAELAALLSGFAARRVAVINTASASGGFVPVLSGPGRIVITATKSGHERNQTRFPRYFVDALTGDGADTDKDGSVSLLEAFLFARRGVAREYESDRRLLTEHALLDDDGDGAGTADPGPDTADGALARTIVFGRVAVAAASADDPLLARLYREKGELERRLAALRQRKAAMAAEAYERQLEELLIALAENGRAIREREGTGRP